MSDKEKIIVGEVKYRFGFLRPLTGLIKKTATFFINTYKSLPKIAKIVFLLIVIVVVAGSVYGVVKVVVKSNPKPAKELTMANDYFRKNDRSQALAHARAALAAAPNDPDAILAVASLVEQDNPSEAQQLYAHALKVFKEQDNPDEDGKKAVTYWAAAQLAEKAGQIVQAKQYYQKVIDAASPSNSYDQSLLKQAQAALKRLP